MSTATVPAALVSDHPAGQIVIISARRSVAAKVSALAGHRLDSINTWGLTENSMVHIADFDAVLASN